MTAIILIVILIMALSALGMPLSAILRASKLPAWARFDPLVSWNNPAFIRIHWIRNLAIWLDGARWPKVLLIKLAQIIIVATLFFTNFIFAFIKVLGKFFVKAVEGTAKSVIKK